MFSLGVDKTNIIDCTSLLIHFHVEIFKLDFDHIIELNI